MTKKNKSPAGVGCKHPTNKNLASPNFFMCVRGRVGCLVMLKKIINDKFILLNNTFKHNYIKL